jgi:hypothetical protein
VDISGQYRIALPRERVWQALMDPEVLRRCMPGCQTLEQTSPDEYLAKVALAIGPVRAVFDTALNVIDAVPPESYRLVGRSKAGPVGFGEGGADIALADEDGAVTLLSYSAGFQVGGRLAQLGSRLVLGATRQLVDEFFESLTTALDSEAQRLPEPPPAAGNAARRFPAAAVVAAVALITLCIVWLLWWGASGG